MSTATPTKPSTLRLSEVARHVVVPSGIVATGWPSVCAKCGELGIAFDGWQHGAGKLILSKRADGLYATTVGGVVISIPRQVGKTFLIGAIVFALCLLVPNLTVIWTAHRLRTANETFASMQGMARRPKTRRFVEKIVLGSGDQEIVFTNGSRILFGARERGFGRGFAGVDVLVFDEAQILTEAAIDDMVPATNTAPNPLILFTGTPPKPSDPGDVFSAKRAEALAGESDDTVYIEFSADDDADPTDRSQWAKANPSFPTRTPVAAMLRMKKNLTAESFLREGLGIWDLATVVEVFPSGTWAAGEDADSAMAGSPAFAVDVAQDRTWSCVTAAGERSDGLWHGQVAENHPGTDWVVSKLVELGVAEVALTPSSPAGSLVPALEAAGIEVVTVSGAEYAGACGHVYDLVKDLKLKHPAQGELDAAVAGAVQRFTVEGAWVFDRRRSDVDISPLSSLALALHLAALERPSTYETQEVRFL